jgi:phosphoglycerate dehydrogenase-like enzyme
VVDPSWDVDWAREQLRDVAVDVQPAQRPEGNDVVGLLVCPEVTVGAAQLARLPRLQAVATNSTGFDNLDVDALAAAGVWCSNVSGYCTEEVAEHTTAFVLALLRGVAELDRGVRAGVWDVTPAPPRRIAGACLGVVGFGRIGRGVTQRALALGMRVLAADPVAPPADIRSNGADPTALDLLLQQADVVTLHAPLEPGTTALIDAAALATMRRGSFLVNCARAGLVDHAALGRALTSGHLAGAALDVLPTEPPIPGEPALTWPRTLVNPHAAWYSPEGARTPYDLAAQDLARALSGDEPVYALARPRR